MITERTNYQIWLPAQTQEEELIYIGESGTKYLAVKDETSGAYYLDVAEMGIFHQEQQEPSVVSKKSVGLSMESLNKTDALGNPVAEEKSYLSFIFGCMVVGLAGVVTLYGHIRRRKEIEKREK